MADLLSSHQSSVERLAEVPGLGVDSAQQILAEVGAQAAVFLAQGILLPRWTPARGTTRARAGATAMAAKPR